MPTNLVLTKPTPELLTLSQRLGFTKTLFMDKDFILLKETNKKELLKKIKAAQKKNLFIIVRPETEELLRFTLEKTPAQMVFGQELINSSDSPHFPRSGLNQILCKIAKEKNKIIAFSFQDILDSKNRPQLLNRIRFNLQLCRKYKVKIFFSNFSTTQYSMRSSSDLKAFLEVLGETNKSALDL